MKRYAGLLWLLTAVGAYSQTADASLTAALGMIRAKPAMVLHAVGTETRPDRVRPIEVDCWSDVDASVPRARFKVASFYDGKFRYGWAADGVQLFHYDPYQNEYSSAIYGSFSGRQPDRLVDSVLQSMVALSKGPAIFPIRFLRDVYAGDAAVYKTWMADVEPVDVSTETSHTITYESAKRKLVFGLEPKTGALLSIDFWEQGGDVTQPRTTTWTLTFSTFDATPNDWNFNFTPPVGCRPVPLVRG